jgi:hypothetical protein
MEAFCLSLFVFSNAYLLTQSFMLPRMEKTIKWKVKARIIFAEAAIKLSV